MGIVGGLDVHKGHGCGLAILVSFVTEDFHALDPSEPFEILLDSIFSDVFREVTHPKVPGLTDHDGQGVRAFRGQMRALEARDLTALVSSYTTELRLKIGRGRWRHEVGPHRGCDSLFNTLHKIIRELK